MKSFRICLQNIRKWSSNSRIWMSLILAVLFVYLYTKGLWKVCDYVGQKISPWIITALFNYRHMKIILMFPIIFIFCDAPFVDSNQPYVMLRTKRSIWSIGQVMYIMLGSIVYTAFLFLSTILVNISYMEWNAGWGDVMGLSGTTNLVQLVAKQGSTVLPSGYVIQYFTPYQAMFFTILLMIMSFIISGLVIYVFNVLTNSKIVGVFIAAFWILFTAVADANPAITWVSPMSWNSLNNIDVGGLTAYPPITYVLPIYIGLIAILSIAAVLLGRKQVIEIQPMV